MFIQLILTLSLIILFLFINYKLWIKKLIFTACDIQEETDLDKTLDEEIEELRAKKVAVKTMKNVVDVEKELAVLDKKMKKLIKKRMIQPEKPWERE